MQPYSLNFPGGMPPDLSSINLLHMLSVNYPFSPRILPRKDGFKGGQEGLLTSLNT